MRFKFLLSIVALMRAGCAAPTKTSRPIDSAIVSACPKPVPVPTKAALRIAKKQTGDRGYLFEIWDTDKLRGYLFGTIHVSQLRWFFPGPKTWQALRNSDVLAVEYDKFLGCGRS